jgi:glutaminase
LTLRLQVPIIPGQNGYARSIKVTELSNALLEEIIEQVRPLTRQGKVADYIPALAGVSPDQAGIAIYVADGTCYQAGDADTRFSIQSISKVLSLTLALTLYDEPDIWQRVGKEPSGQAFNSLLQLELEQGKPRNPFINAGALVMCDLLESRLTAPRQRMLEIVRHLAQRNGINYDRVVARSEYEHSARNAAIAWLMKSFGNFHNDVSKVMETYFHYCAMAMSCTELARTFFYLANQGRSLGDEITVISPRHARQVNALMMTSGMYDGAGEFAWRVGMPAKSGVGGGIIAVIPGEMSIAVWSPALDSSGNSLAGTVMLEMLTERLGRSIF